MKNFLDITSASAAVAICLLPSVAYADAPAAPAPATATKDAPIEEIVVTAQKRTEKLSNVGMTITAVTGEQLVSRGVKDVTDLTKIEPSLQYTKSNNGLPVYTIRGVGFYDQSLASASTVSLYLDEQPFAFAALSKGALLDLQRVEVLKGPQGTLYGQNATGGAINFISAQPTDHFTAGVNATYGRFNAASIDGYVSGPLSGTLTGRLAARIDEGGAWQRSDTRDDSLGNQNFKTARLLLNWAPTSNFTARLDINGFTDDSDSQAAQLEGIRFSNPAYISPPGPNVPSYYLPNPANYATYPKIIQQQVANQPAPANDRAADWVAGTHPRNRERYIESTLRMDYTASDALTFTSLTKYEAYSQHNLQDSGGLNVVDTNATILGHVHSFAQELRASGRLDGNKIDWLVGLNYSNDKGAENEQVPSYDSGTFLTGGSIYSPLTPLAPNFFNQPFTFFGVIHNSQTDTKSAFGNVNFQITDQINIHGGVRYTQSIEKAASCSDVDSVQLSTFLSELADGFTGTTNQPVIGAFQCNTFLPNGTQGIYNTRQVEHNVPWRVGIDWKPAANDLIYLTVSKGFKAGGSPALGASSSIQLQPVVQESLLAYEAGFKSLLLDRKVQLDGAVFYYDYRNKQFLGRIPDPLGIFGALQALVNIPKSHEIGAEAAVTVRPVSGLTLEGAATYLFSKIDSNFENYSPYPTGPDDTIDLHGEAFPYTPKWAFSYGARYDWTLNSRFSAFVAVNGQHQTSTVAAFGAAQADARGPSFDIKGYGLLDLSAGIETQDKSVRLTVWGKNVLNTYYWSNVFYAFDTVARYAGRPSTYGVTINYRY